MTVVIVNDGNAQWQWHTPDVDAHAQARAFVFLGSTVNSNQPKAAHAAADQPRDQLTRESAMLAVCGLGVAV